MKTIKSGVLLLLLAVLFAACQPDSLTPPPEEPVSSDDTPMPSQTPPGDDVRIEENAIVEEVDILMLESFPLQVNVNIKGQFRDGCTSLHDSWAEQTDETTFVVHIQTTRPADAMCTEALVPFEVNVPLEVNGLKAGTYTVKVYDLEKEFTFEQDNVLPE